MTTPIDPNSIKPILEYFGQEGLTVSSTIQLAISRLKALNSFKRLLSLATTPAILEKNPTTKRLFQEFHTILDHISTPH